MCEDNQHQV